jgi:diaminopimelate epimerase
MTSRAIAVAVVAAAIAVPALIHAQTKSADRAFVTAGKVDIHLDGGDYEVRAAADNHIRVTMTGNTGSAAVDVTIAGTHADVTVKNTPHTNFHCVIEVPKVSDVAIRLTGGDLKVEEIAGSKDIEATAGDVTIAAGDPSNYSKVDASVAVGDLSAGPFGQAKGAFVSKSLNWSGKGKSTLHARLGAGDLKLR